MAEPATPPLTAAERERLLDWVRSERGLPWEGEVVRTVAHRLDRSVLDVRAEAFGEHIAAGTG
jgi:hypothetical protein